MTQLHTKTIAALTALFLNGVCALHAQESTNAFPKGQYVEQEIHTQSYSKSNTLYSADAHKMAADFTSSDFSLQSTNGVEDYGTGNYTPNAQFQAKSRTIDLPTAENGNIYLELVYDLETESHYDYASVWVLAHGSETEVFRQDGRIADIADIDLTAYAGKQIEIVLRLNADDAEQGRGWRIYNIALFQGSVNN